MTGSEHRQLPDFIIIGAMKAGTTSLFAYLRRHPALSGCLEKEPGFFTDAVWNRGTDWYQSLFPDNADLKFEASTNYTKFPQFDHVPERMHDLLPDARLIYVVRHPLNRLISQLHHLIVRQHLDEAVDYSQISFWEGSGKALINTSCYHLQYTQYLKYYDASAIHILRFEDLIADPAAQLNTILGFLGLEDRYFDRQADYSVHNELSTRARVRFKRLHAKLRGIAIRRNMPSLYRFLETPVPRPVLSTELLQWIWQQITDDLQQFQEAIDRDLGYHAPV